MIIELKIFLSLILSFTIAHIIIPKIVKVAHIKNLFDIPNHRSAAKKATPRLGGFALLGGFLIGFIVAADSFNIDPLKYMFAGIIAMFLIGIKDDFIGLAARKKFVIQLIMAFYLVVAGNYIITDLHGFFGLNELYYPVSVVLSVIIIVGIINSINLIDGIDGLASGLSLLISLVYGTFFFHAGELLYALVCFSLNGSLVSFFIYNVFGKKNKVFLGDGGSLILGTTISLLTIHFNEFTPTTANFPLGLPAISFAIIMVPVIDTIRVFAIRISQGRSPFSPDMNHIHHNLLRLTNSHIKTTLIILVANSLFIICAFLLIDQIGNSYLFLLLLIFGFLLANVPSMILRFQNNEKQVTRENRLIYPFTFLLNKFRA